MSTDTTPEQQRAGHDGRSTAVVSQVLGNLDDPEWAERLADEDVDVDVIELDQWMAQRSRLRRATVGGRDLAVSLARDRRLRDGDVVAWDEDARQAVVARVRLGQVMVLDLSPLLERSPELAARGVFELGHAIGNQHWPAVVRGTTIYVPVTVDDRVMASVMRTHGFDDVGPRFVAGQEVLPYLAPHEARQLFGGADQGVHSHATDPEDPS